MRIQKKIAVISILPPFYEGGVLNALSEQGYESFTPSVISNSPTKVELLIVGRKTMKETMSLLQSLISKYQPSSKVVIAHTLSQLDLNRLKAMGVHAVLGYDMEIGLLCNLLPFLPNHWMYDTRLVLTTSTLIEKLTPKEKEVLNCFGAGNNNKEIASIMKISVKTVETHRNSIMKKLHLSTPQHLALWYKDHCEELAERI